MIDRFLYFLKLFIQLICWMCVAVAGVGATTTGDTFFLICGIIAIAMVGYRAIRIINESMNQTK